MKPFADSPLHLSYCLNVHPGESWEDQFRAIRDLACRVRDLVAGKKRFGLGLRLSAQSARQLRHAEELEVFRAFLRSENLYVFTVNAFPYGAFHGERVKTAVYKPDWSSRERLEYTLDVAHILASLVTDAGLPDGSISTVPATYRPWSMGATRRSAIIRNLAELAQALDELAIHSGKVIHVGLEPEPDCLLESTADYIEFFESLLLPGATDHLRRVHGRCAADAERILRRHIGVCVDTCHSALVFEDPRAAIGRYRRAGMRVSKVQLSAAIACEATTEALEALRAFDEPVYLHQVKGWLPGEGLRSWPDLPPLLANPSSMVGCESLRVHFHVPMFWDRWSGPLRSTARTLTQGFFADLRGGGLTEHVEVETYTFHVLPREMAERDVTRSIAHELRWALDAFGRMDRARLTLR